MWAMLPGKGPYVWLMRSKVAMSSKMNVFVDNASVIKGLC